MAFHRTAVTVLNMFRPALVKSKVPADEGGIFLVRNPGRNEGVLGL